MKTIVTAPLRAVLRPLIFVVACVACLAACAPTSSTEGSESATTSQTVATAAPREGMNSINDFMLGMSKDDAGKKGAALFPQDPGIMTATVDWNGIAWNAQLIFDTNKLSILVLTGPLTGEMVNSVLNFAGQLGYMPFNIRYGSNDINIYELAANGKTPAECDTVLGESLNAFATGQESEGTIMLSGMNLFARLVAVIQTKGDENAILVDAKDDPLLAMVMDKADGTLIMIFSTWGTMTSD